MEINSNINNNCNIQNNTNTSTLMEEENYFVNFKPFFNDINNSIKKSKRHSKFNKNFIKLRSDLKMEKISRKTQFDSILKKTKAKVFRTIHDAIKKCLNINFNNTVQNSNLNSFRLLRLPQNFITNIKIEFNKEYLNKTIYEIYNEFEIIEDFEEKDLIKEERKILFKDFMNLTFREAYEYYITSKIYLKDREYIKRKEGEKFSILFAFIAQNFIEYYTQSKGNKTKKVRKGLSQEFNKNNSINNINEKKIVNNKNDNNDYNYNVNSNFENIYDPNRKKFFKIAHPKIILQMKKVKFNRKTKSNSQIITDDDPLSHPKPGRIYFKNGSNINITSAEKKETGEKFLNVINNNEEKKNIFDMIFKRGQKHKIVEIAN